jgi:hypothetical protein
MAKIGRMVPSTAMMDCAASWFSLNYIEVDLATLGESAIWLERVLRADVRRSEQSFLFEASADQRSPLPRIPQLHEKRVYGSRDYLSPNRE